MTQGALVSRAQTLPKLSEDAFTLLWAWPIKTGEAAPGMGRGGVSKLASEWVSGR